MASLYITEYQGVGYVAPGYDGMSFKIPAQAPLGPPTAEQKMGITGVAAQSSGFNQYTRLIRVHCDVVCSVFVGGLNPTATGSSGRLAANQTEYFCVNPGEKLSVISNT